MDGIIFEDPSKQVSRPKKSSRRVLPPGERAAHNGATQTQERESILLNLDGSNDYTGDDETAYGGQASLNDLFDLSEGDEHSTNNDVASDDLFSPQEQNEQATDSDTSVESAPGGIAKSIPRDHSAVSDQTAPGDSQSDPINLEDDKSGVGTAKRSMFCKRKPGSELGGFDSRIPLSLSNPKGGHTMDDRESQCGDEDVGKHDSTTITRKRHHHGDHGRVGKGDDDGDGSVGVQDANRQTVLNPPRRNVKDTADWTSQRAKKRHRSVSSVFLSSDESDQSDRVVASRKKATPSQSHFFRPHRHGDSPFPTMSSEDLTPDREGRSTADILQSSGLLTDRAIESDPNPVNSSSRLQEMEEMAQSDSNGACLNADDSQETAQDEIEWPHGRLLEYKEVDGKPLVQVPWYPTWEPPDEYSTAEVERVKRRWQLRRRGKGRGKHM